MDGVLAGTLGGNMDLLATQWRWRWAEGSVAAWQ